MARENQGLQIALIIFVILTIMLGVTTFIFFKQGEDAEARAEQAEQSARQKDDLARNVLEENSRLKGFMGFPDTERIEEISDQVNADLLKYAANFRDEPRGYRQALAYLFTTIQDRARDLEAAKVEIQELKDQIPRLEAANRAQIAQHVSMAEQKAEELASTRQTFQTVRTRFETDTAQIQEQLARGREQATQNVRKISSTLEDANKRIQGLTGELRDQQRKIREFHVDSHEAADGEITWVNQRNRTVWINRGRADALERQTTFSVYPADATTLGPDVKKASIEVTQILGDHLAEARIVEDSSRNPIVPGDLVHTPVWSPGDRRRFALAGLLDATGDGRNDLELVKNLIAANGGVVDAFADPAGNRQGQVTVNTRYLVVGERPDERGKPEGIREYTRLVSEAERLGIQTIPLGELLEMMGWQNRARVERLGEGATRPELGPRGQDGVPRSSPGNVSELFRPRTPPRRPGGAY